MSRLLAPLLLGAAALLVVTPIRADDLLLAHPQVELPISDATVPNQLAVRVVVGDGRIDLDGVQVQTLDRLDEVKRGSLITPLYDALVEKADTEKQLAAYTLGTFEGKLLLAAARDVSWAVVADVMYTAGQAQYGKHLIQVSGPSPSGPGGPSTFLIRTALPEIFPPGREAPPEAHWVALIKTTDEALIVEQYPPRSPGFSLEDPPEATVHTLPNLGPAPDFSALEALMREIKPTCPTCLRVIIQPRDADSWQTVVHLLDATRESRNQPLFPEPVLARGRP